MAKQLKDLVAIQFLEHRAKILAKVDRIQAFIRLFESHKKDGLIAQPIGCPTQGVRHPVSFDGLRHVDHLF